MDELASDPPASVSRCFSFSSPLHPFLPLFFCWLLPLRGSERVHVRVRGTGDKEAAVTLRDGLMMRGCARLLTDGPPPRQANSSTSR